MQYTDSIIIINKKDLSNAVTQNENTLKYVFKTDDPFLQVKSKKKTRFAGALYNTLTCTKSLRPLLSPTRSDGYSFGIMRAPVRPSVHIFVRQDPDLSTHWSDLMLFWYMDSQFPISFVTIDLPPPP